MRFEIRGFKLNGLKFGRFNLSGPKFSGPNLVNFKFRDNLDDSSWDNSSCLILYSIIYTHLCTNIVDYYYESQCIDPLFSLSLCISFSFRHHMVQHCKITRFEHNYTHETSIETGRWRESRNRWQKVNVLCVHVEAQWRFSLMRPFNDGNEWLATAFETTPDARVGYRC